MLKKLVTVFIISSMTTTSFACKTPSKSQLQNFFGNKPQWKTFGAQLNLVFNNYKSSTLNSLKGNARIKKVCLQGNHLKVITTKGEATVARSGNRVLVMPSQGGKYTFSPASSEPLSFDESFVIRERFPRARYEGLSSEPALYNTPREQSESLAIDL